MARFMPDAAPLPALDDFNRDFFTAGKLMIQQCTACQTVQHPPDHVCYKCQGTSFTSREASGTGTVYSYIVVHNPPGPAYADVVPYTVALVVLDDMPDIRVLGNIVNQPPSEVEIGKKVRAVFEEIPDEEQGETLKLPQWELV